MDFSHPLLLCFLQSSSIVSVCFLIVVSMWSCISWIWAPGIRVQQWYQDKQWGPVIAGHILEPCQYGDREGILKSLHLQPMSSYKLRLRIHRNPVWQTKRRIKKSFDFAKKCSDHCYTYSPSKQSAQDPPNKYRKASCLVIFLPNPSTTPALTPTHCRVAAGLTPEVSVRIHENDCILCLRDPAMCTDQSKPMR